MTSKGNFFVNQESEKWRWMVAYLRDTPEASTRLRVSDLARDTSVPPHEIINRLTAANISIRDGKFLTGEETQ